MRRLIRRSLRTGGDPVDRPYSRAQGRAAQARRPLRRVRLDGRYARALLLFLHAVVGSGRGVEAFAFGTRLSRLTPELATRDPDAALDQCTEAVVDWGSGTRIGASLKRVQRRLRPARAVARRGRA